MTESALQPVRRRGRSRDRRRARAGAGPPARLPRDDRVARTSCPSRCSSRRARCSPTSTPRATRAGATTAAASTSTSPRTSPSTAPSRCSAPSTPTCSRTRVPRRTPPCCTRIATPGDTILGLELAHGGHLTHGMKLNFSGKLYNAVAYGVDPETFLVDMDVVRAKALEHRPQGHHRRLVGLPAPPRLRRLPRDRRRGRRDAVGRHGALRRARGRGPAPEPGAARATSSRSTVHKTIGGPRSGFILTQRRGHRQEDQLRRLPRPAGRTAHARDRREGDRVQARRDARVQGPPGAHDQRRAHPRRAPHAQDVKDAGIDVLHRRHRRAPRARRPARLRRSTASRPKTCLHEVGITVNRNAVPFDPRPPMVTSGLRIGTPALATRGFGDAEFTEVADIIATAPCIAGPATDLEALPRRVGAAHRRVPALPAALQQVARDDAPISVSTARLDGAARIKAELTERVAALRARGSCPASPRVLVGADPASQLTSAEAPGVRRGRHDSIQVSCPPTPRRTRSRPPIDD